MRYLISGLLLFILALSTAAQYRSTAQDGAATQAPDAFVAGGGVGSLENLGANDLSYQVFAGKLWNAGALFGIKAIAEVTSDFDNAILASALIGANYYPVRSAAFAPYIGAATGIGYANGSRSGDDALGFDLSSTIGFLLFRAAPLQIKIEGNANFLFREFGDNGEMPMTFSGRLGLLF